MAVLNQDVRDDAVVLVVNSGSSSLKLSVVAPDGEALDAAELAPIGAVSPGVLDDAVDALRTAAGYRLAAVGHRVVHGGTRFVAPTIVDDAVRAELEDLAALAPLHQPKSLAALDTVSRLVPQLPAVACFDTAFHAHLPAAAATYAVPASWQRRWGVRKYGFHGLSHAWCSRRAAELVDSPTDAVRTVSCHLGSGASLAAVAGGRSVDTTMGFTPLDGLVMGTRSGSVDPGLVLWLEEHENLSPHDVASALEHHSGLLALTGSADLREIEARMASGDTRAQQGFDVFVHRIATGIGAMAVAAGGLDVLAFTGGIGEHSPAVRAAVVQQLGFLGAAIDPSANRAQRLDCDISAPGTRVRTVVVRAREDVEIARGTLAALATSPAGR